MNQCYFLTADELAAYLAAGYTVVSGPHPTEEECLYACESLPEHDPESFDYGAADGFDDLPTVGGPA